MPDPDLVLARTSLGRLADEVLGAHRGSARSPVWPCPDRGHPGVDRTATVAVFTTRRGEQRWHCDTCGAGGTAIDLVMKARRMTRRQALEFLDARATPSRITAAPSDIAEDPRTGSPRRQGADAWIARATGLLWEPYGEAVLDWLTTVRRLPEDVLRTNRIGATAITPDYVLPTRRFVAGHRGASMAAVLPMTMQTGPPGNAEIHLIAPNAGEPRYMLPSQDAAPPLALYRPGRRLHHEIVVSANTLDALAATAAGYRAAAICPGVGEAELALHLARLQGPLVYALGPEDLAEGVARPLARYLSSHGRRLALMHTITEGLSDSLATSHDWTRKLGAHVQQAFADDPVDLARTTRTVMER